jgi:hypothetical protein
MSEMTKNIRRSCESQQNKCTNLYRNYNNTKEKAHKKDEENNMARPKKSEVIVNQLEDTPVADILALNEMDADDVVIGELSEEEAAVSMEILNQMQDKTVVNASKRQKRSLYNSGTIIGMDDDDLSGLVTEEDVRRTTFNILNQSRIAGSYISGTIIKAMARNKEEGSAEMPTAIVQMENDDYFTIKIPFTDFLPKDRLPEEVRGNSARDKLNYMDMLINARTGAKIRFVVKSIDERTGEVLASRTDAMRANIRKKWFERNRDGSFVINLGDDVIGNVIYVDRTTICVEAMGLEKVLNIADVSWIRYSDLRDAPLKLTKVPGSEQFLSGPYAPGDLIRLRVVGIRRTFRDVSTPENAAQNIILDEKDIAGKRVRPNGVAVALSAKACTINPDQKFYKDFEIGEKCQAVVTHVDENGIFCKLANKRSGKILFNADTPLIPTVGKRCLVRIVKKDPDGFRISCEVVQSYR